MCLLQQMLIAIVSFSPFKWMNEQSESLPCRIILTIPLTKWSLRGPTFHGFRNPIVNKLCSAKQEAA